MSAVLIVVLDCLSCWAARYGPTRSAVEPAVEVAPFAVTDCFVVGHHPQMVGVPGCNALARTENESRSSPTVSRTAVPVGADGRKYSVLPSTHQSWPVRSAISATKPKSLSACMRYSCRSWDAVTSLRNPYSRAICETTSE